MMRGIVAAQCGRSFCWLIAAGAFWGGSGPVDAAVREQGIPQASRLAHVDAAGVLRWQDDGAEVALFGVNYYTPFWHNYPDLKGVGADYRKTIDEDVTHFARMGLDVIRLHVFDRELSDQDGNLIDNEHLQLLDYLVARAKERGIYTVLTPIAWWPVPGDSPGFSTRFTMPQMAGDLEARKLQSNYLAQFVVHTNRFTGLCYRDDPAVVAFELINEPQYAPGTTEAQVAGYIDALAGAVRQTGNRKPVFYNGWGGQLGAVRKARVEGSTFGWYPSGLVAGRSLRRNFLPVVDQHPDMGSPALGPKAKIVYEFDAADIPGSYIYPAMARAFRSGGAQIAAQFQYDPMPLAPFNQGWQTHYLNLVYSPQKAVSFLIAAEAFRRLPRGGDYGRFPQNCRFGSFRVSYEEDLSEMVTDREFLYSNSTRTDPPASDKLERVIGCGSSSVVRYEGTGAYFIERMKKGAWRLEVYPDAVWVNDPYGPHSTNREVSRVLWRTWPMEIRLGDLGGEFSAVPLNEGNTWRTVASDGVVNIRPGVYMLTAKGVPDGGVAGSKPGAQVRLSEFVAPPETRRLTAVRHEPVGMWIENKPLPLEFTIAGTPEPEAVEVIFSNSTDRKQATRPITREWGYLYRVEVPGDWLATGQASYALRMQIGGASVSAPLAADFGGEATNWVVAVLSSNAPIPLFEAEKHPVRFQGDLPIRQSLVPGMGEGRRALRCAVEKFGPPPSSVSFRHELSDWLEAWRDALAGRSRICLRMRALETTTTGVEVVLVERDGAPWGTNVALTSQWQEVRVPFSSLRYFGHWGGTPAGRGSAGDRLRPRELAGLNVCFGAWLYPDHAAEPHTIEIESITVE